MHGYMAKGRGKMKILRTGAMLLITCGTVFANDVYIDQAGDSSTITVIQQNGTNTVNSSSDAETLSGDSISLSITQDGNLNNADIELENSATSSNVDIDVLGTSNETNVSVDGASSTTVDIDITGDTNWATVCGSNDSASGVAMTCTGGITDSTTSNSISITGDTNAVNIEATGASQTNTVTIGADSLDLSDANTVDILNDVTGSNVILNIDGQDNDVDITVQ